MDTIQKNPVVLCEEDYKFLKKLVDMNPGNSGQEMSLSYEVNRAIVVKDNAFPPNTIRINSRVRVLDLDSGKESEFIIVMPHQADIQQMKISILTPMGAAVIGFRPGDELSWQMPAGLKHFKVLDVQN
jgi:regulator of nucleoside diphosphate kinase